MGAAVRVNVKSSMAAWQLGKREKRPVEACPAFLEPSHFLVSRFDPGVPGVPYGVEVDFSLPSNIADVIQSYVFRYVRLKVATRSGEF